jgi:hypothetical protein
VLCGSPPTAIWAAFYRILPRHTAFHRFCSIRPVAAVKNDDVTACRSSRRAAFAILCGELFVLGYRIDLYLTLLVASTAGRL